MMKQQLIMLADEARPKQILVHGREVLPDTYESHQSDYAHRLKDQYSHTKSSNTESKPPNTNLLSKAREVTRLSRNRLSATLHNHDQPLSDIGRFHKYYVECYNYGKNERIITSRVATDIQVKDGHGVTCKVIHGAAHNYLGLYEATSESEGLQKQCLENLPVLCNNDDSSLESALNDAVCNLYKVDFCCTTGTGYGSNLLAFPAILSTSWALLMDEKSHNSMFVAAYAGEVGILRKFRHNDTKHLESLIIEASKSFSNILVAIEGLYSMEATTPPLDDLAILKQRHNLTILADEAHSFLALGRSGKGCVESWNDQHPDRPVPSDLIDIRTATLSKAPGTVGGLVFGNARFKEAVLTRRSLLSGHGMDAISFAAIIQTVSVLGQPELRAARSRRLLSMIKHVRTQLTNVGLFVYGSSVSPALPVHTGAPTLAGKFFEALRDAGVLSSPIVTPAVGFWQGRIRLTLNAGAESEAVDRLTRSVIAAAQKTGLINKTSTEVQPFLYAEEENDDKQLSELAEVTRRIRDLMSQDILLHASSSRLGTSIREIGHKARRDYGLACGGSRWISGTTSCHKQLDDVVASFLSTESALTYPDSYVGLASTVAALCRPASTYKRHHLLHLPSLPEAVKAGLRIAPPTSKPKADLCNDLDSLARKAKSFAEGRVQLTIYLPSTSLDKLNTSSIISTLNQVGRKTSVTILLHDTEGPCRSTAGIVKQLSNVQVLMFGTFGMSGLPGSYLGGSAVLIKELKYTSRGYMFTSSHMPFIVAMAEEEVKNL